MANDNWIILWTSLIVIWILGWAPVLMNNVELYYWIFGVGLSILFAILICTIKFRRIIDFESRIEPNAYVRADLHHKFQLVWKFKNNINRPIKILSYYILICLSKKEIYNSGWIYTYKTTIGAKSQHEKKWDLVECYYYHIKQDGTYEFQSRIEYELHNGKKKIADAVCELEVEGSDKIKEYNEKMRKYAAQ